MTPCIRCIRALALCAVWFALAVVAAAAGPFWTPPPGSAERAAIMDAVRGPVEQELGQPIIFAVKTLRVTNDWVFLHAVPQRPDGSPVDYATTSYGEAQQDGSFDDQVAALLARDGSGWRVVTYAIGFTDVAWDGWDETHGAPAWLWP